MDPKLFLHNHPADPRDYQYNRSKDRDRHAGHVEFRNEVLPDQSGQSRVLSGKHIIEIRKHVPHHIGDITGLAVSEKHQELFIGDVHAVALEHHVGKTSEGIHPGQCGNKGRYIDFRDPEPLENPDAEADQQHDQHRQPRIRASRHQDAADRRGKADHRADGKVNVAAGQDAQQHACRQHENIGVFGNQSGQVGGQKDQPFLSFPGGENDRYDDQGDDHHILLKKRPDLEFLLIRERFLPGGSACILIHGHAPLPDLRIVAMMFSCVASSAFISPTILASFMI